MKLPGAEQAAVDRSKVADYLLSESHPVGRFKSTFFLSLGYSRDDWQILGEDLVRHLLENDAVATELTRYGQKYEVRGSLTVPVGRTVSLVTVWIILHSEAFPRFVTAFPGRKT